MGFSKDSMMALMSQVPTYTNSSQCPAEWAPCKPSTGFWIVQLMPAICVASSHELPSDIVPGYLFTQPLSHWQDMTQDQFLSRVKLVLNLEIFFSKTGCITKTKEPNLFYYLPITSGENEYIDAFSKGITTKWKHKQSHPGLNMGHQFHFLWQ